MNDFLKRFKEMDYRLFSDTAINIIAGCDQGGLYNMFGMCENEEDVNIVATELISIWGDLY